MADFAFSPGSALVVPRGYVPLFVQSVATNAPDALVVKTLIQLFPNQSVPFIDSQNRVSNEWYRYLAAALKAATSGVNALDPVEVQRAIEDSRANVARIDALSAALRSQAVNNATVLQAVINSIQAAPEIPMTTTIPPVQNTVDSTGGGD